MLSYFLIGGQVMYPLLACSLIVTTVIIERGIFWTRTGMRRNRPLLDEVMELCRRGDWPAVQDKTRGCKDYLIRILISGILCGTVLGIILPYQQLFDVLGRIREAGLSRISLQARASR